MSHNQCEMHFLTLQHESIRLRHLSGEKFCSRLRSEYQNLTYSNILILFMSSLHVIPQPREKECRATTAFLCLCPKSVFKSFSLSYSYTGINSPVISNACTGLIYNVDDLNTNIKRGHTTLLHI